MNIELGQIYKINNQDYCVIDILDYNSKKYYLFFKQNGGVDYVFYELAYTDGKNYKLLKVIDENLRDKLFELEDKQ